jgi:hypothetical protein
MSRQASSGEIMVRNFIDENLRDGMADIGRQRNRQAARAVSKLIVATAIANWAEGEIVWLKQPLLGEICRMKSHYLRTTSLVNPQVPDEMLES